MQAVRYAGNDPIFVLLLTASCSLLLCERLALHHYGCDALSNGDTTMNSRINRLLPPEVRQELALRYRLFFSFVASKARRLSRNVVKEVENFSDFCAFTYRQPRTGARIARNWFLEDVVTLKVLLIIIWVLLLNYGEISVFEKHIKRCDWSSWENWV